MKKLIIAAVTLAASFLVSSVWAEPTKITAKDIDEKGCWTADGEKLNADKEGDDAEAIAVVGAGTTYCWMKALVGSSFTANVNGAVMKPEFKGKEGEYVWVMVGQTMTVAGYMPLMLHQVGTKKSSIAEIRLADAKDYKPDGAK